MSPALPSYDPRRWYVVISKPNAEQKAVLALLTRGYEPFLPQCLVTVRHDHGSKEMIKPLFKRYLFVAQIEGQGFAPILSTPGVAEVIRTAGRTVCTIPGAKVDAFKRWMEAEGGAIDLRRKAAPHWKAGTRVVIVTGPLAGFAGVCVSSSAERVKILIDMLGKWQHVNVAAESIEAAG